MKDFWNHIKKAKGWLGIVALVFLFNTFTTFHFIYILSKFSNVENIGRLIVGVITILLWLFITFKLIQSLFKRKIKRYLRVCILTIIYSTILFIITTFASTALSKLGQFTTTKTTYSASIVALKEDKATDLKGIGNKKIGMIKDEKSVDGYQIPQEIIKTNNLKNKIEKYDSYPHLIDALLNEEVKYAFLPTNYAVMFKSMEQYKDLGEKTKIIYTQKKEVKNQARSNKKLTEPFTVLLMGVDSELEDVRNSSYNGDSLMLITFNPNTLNTTIMSIPRDTYVPIACFPNKRKNKITHAAWYGEDCMIKTIEGFTGITIDYYAKINFKGVVKLVDTLGGIDVDIPLGFCEQDSNRDFGNLQCLEPGKQTINGEQALAWARHRKSAGFDDFVRGQNQQEVVKGILNKLKDVRDLDTVYKILDSLGNTMETNMTRDEILSLYNVGKDVLLKSKDMPMEDLLSMQKLYISGYDEYIYDYSQIDGAGTGLELYNFVPYKQSLKEITTAMKVNLELQEHKMIKTFSFDVNDEYEENVIGKGDYSGASVTLLPDFTGYDKSEAISFGAQHGFTVTIKETTGSTMGMVVNQNLPSGMDIDYVTNLVIYVVTNPIEETPKEEPDEKPSESATPTPPTTDDSGSEENTDDGSSEGGNGENNGGDGSGSGTGEDTENPVLPPELNP